jgi:GntR family transcriptional regulator
MSRNWIAARLRARPSLAEQAADDLRSAIREGVFGDGGQLPSEPELSRQLGVSRPTVRHALSLLEQQGLVLRRQGLGTFVLSSVAELADLLNTNSGVTEMIRSAGRRPGASRITVGTGAADARVAAHLAIPVGASVATIERVRTADDHPVALTRDVMPSDLLVDHEVMPDRLEAFVGSEGGSLYRSLAVAGIPVEYGVVKILPGFATPSLAESLGLSVGAMLMVLEQTDYGANGRPVLFSEEYLVPGVLSIYAFRRGPG